MCGIIGMCGSKVSKKDIEVLKKIMIESRIRGKHASGIAWWTGKSIESVVKPEPIDELVEEFDFNRLLHNGQVSMIAHARYSTSDIAFNQPLVGSTVAIAHNGVITQSHPRLWAKLYNYECKTKNDSELLLRCIENGDNPYKVFEGSSIAALVLNNGKIEPLRNGERPLWTGKTGEIVVWASTYDILNRAGVTAIQKIEPYGKEYQRRNYKSWKIQRKV